MSRVMSRKEAVDQSTRDYWAKYFGPYGKRWTDDIPRRVARALAASLRQAAKKTQTPQLRVVRATITPLACAETATGGLVFEGFFRGDVVRAGRKSRELKAFRAEFTANGKLSGLKAIAA